MIDAIKYGLIDRKLQREAARRYYGEREFARVDRALLKTYLFKNPYQVSKRFLQKRREGDIHTYGETPLMTYEVIGKELGLGEGETFLELGCGRGRGLFFLSHFFGCQTVGVEQIPLFVRLGKTITNKHQIEGVSLLRGDFSSVKLPVASAVYLYGTCLAEVEVKKLAERLKAFPSGTRIVSVSYPLTDYDAKAFEIEKRFSVGFPWGETDAYLQTRI